MQTWHCVSASCGTVSKLLIVLELPSCHNVTEMQIDWFYSVCAVTFVALDTIITHFTYLLSLWGLVVGFFKVGLGCFGTNLPVALSVE